MMPELACETCVPGPAIKLVVVLWLPVDEILDLNATVRATDDATPSMLD